MAYNSELYANYTEAQKNPRGIAIIAVFLSVSITILFISNILIRDYN